MSFCRITGRSRGLPKPHYFPIIPPVSPAEARRFCRITGKSYGLPMHHYIPVLLRKSAILSKCRITKVADMFGKRKHHPLTGFRYVCPLLDPKSEAHKNLIELLTTKSGEGQFVYVVKERRCSVVISAQMESAVRDGTIKDVMLAKDSDKVLLRMKQGDNLSVDIKELNEDEYMAEELFEGEGVGEDEVEEETENKSKKNKKNALTKGLAKIFEEREQTSIAHQTDLQQKNAKKENIVGIKVKTNDWRNLIQPLIECWDWSTFEMEASKLIPSSKWTPEQTSNVKNVKNQENVTKIVSQPIQKINEVVKQIEPVQLEKTENVIEKLNENDAEYLPSIEEIPEILNKLSTGVMTERNGVTGMDILIDRPRFIVGQMVKTSTNNNMFIPGQTLNTDSGKTFVPGFVVNTFEGPGMVPGVVLTKQKNVTFLPGQHISNEGQCEFIVNKTIILENTNMCEECVDAEGKLENNGDVIFSESVEKELENYIDINSNVMQKSYVNAELISNIEKESNISLQDVKCVSEKLGFKNEILEKISEMVLAITHVANNIVYSKSSSFCLGNNQTNEFSIENLQEEIKENIIVLKNALLTAVNVLQDSLETSSEVHYEDVFFAVGNIFANMQNKELVLESLCKILQSTEMYTNVFSNIIEQENHKLPNVSKMDILKSALTLKNLDETTLTEKLSSILNEDILVPAFQNVSSGNPDFLKVILGIVEQQLPEFTSDAMVSEALYKAIVIAVKDSSEEHLGHLLKSEGSNEVIGDLLQEAIGLALALGMDDTADRLYSVLSDPQSTDILAEDAVSLEILKRLTVMRQIADKSPTLHSALGILKKDPRGARSDPKLRELVRKSAVLMVPEVKLHSSDNIPCRLFYSNNMLAMEDFMTRNRQSGTLLIIKKGWQAVVPKEASRAVLNGKVAYTLIDETGIRHFKPMDVFSALRLSKPTARRFSMYECLGASSKQSEKLDSDKLQHPVSTKMRPCMVAERLA